MNSTPSLEDLQLSLKLELKDHAFTKQELSDLQKHFSEFKDSQQTLIQSKLAEIRNIHQVEKEHLNNRLQMSEIKYKNLQIQYDELVAKTADKCEEL